MVRRIVGLVVVVAVALSGCTSYTLYRKAQIAEQQDDWDEAVLRYLELVERDPDNLTYRTALLRAKIAASQAHFDAGKRFHEAGQLRRALVEYRQAVELDPTNQYALVELGKVRDELARRERGEAGTIEEMKAEAKRKQPPTLDPRSDEPISLEFPEPVPVKDIYRALGKAFGINILFDPNLEDQRIAINLRDVTAQDALEILMRAAQHFYKVLDEHTILIAADTAQNRRAYEDLVIQTFFLSNAEVKDVMTMLRTLVDAKKVAANEQLNAIIMRDTADRVEVAERLIAVNDKARAEVVVDVELLQVNSSRIRELGMSLSQYSIGQSIDPGFDVNPDAAGVQLNLSDFEHINQTYWTLTIPSFIYDFVKNDSDAQVLARPQVRITDGEEANLHIGDRVPIPTTSFNTANTVGSNIVPITSFQYTDIGIKIKIEPRVHHNNEISLNLSVEVSNISGSVQGSGGQEQPIIGTRNIATVIRLKDGETNFLAGLLRTDESTSDTGLPGLSEIPLLGRLFSRTTQDNQRTDVILTMTPHIIRRSDITEEDLVPIWVGTEQNITFRGGSPRVESPEAGPFDEGSSAAERVRELIRQRVRELPQGLQEGAQEGTREEREPPAGIELAPTGGIGETPPESDEEEQEAEPPPDEPEDEGADLGSAADLSSAPLVDEAPTETSGTRAILARQEEPTTAPAVRLRLLPARLVVAPGERFTLEVAVAAETPISHLPAMLGYDPGLLAVVGWERGDFLGPAGESEVLAAEKESGELLIGASRLGGLGADEGVSGDGTVMRVTFEAQGPGATSIEFREAGAMAPGLTARGVATSGAVVTIEEGERSPNDGPERPDRPRRPRERPPAGR